jgi:hypothetical protein
MILTLTILAGIGYLLSMIPLFETGKYGNNTFLATIFTILCWNTCFPLSVITMAIWFVFFCLKILFKN